MYESCFESIVEYFPIYIIGFHLVICGDGIREIVFHNIFCLEIHVFLLKCQWDILYQILYQVLQNNRSTSNCHGGMAGTRAMLSELQKEDIYIHFCIINRAIFVICLQCIFLKGQRVRWKVKNRCSSFHCQNLFFFFSFGFTNAMKMFHVLI